MTSIRSAMEEAINAMITEAKDTPSTRVSLIQFDSENPYEVVFERRPVLEVGPITINPRGGTPLVDAFVKTIDNTGLRFAWMDESKRPSKVLMIVITDGEENASKTYKRTDVFNRVTRQTNDYKWQFVYLGANQDAIAEAASYGITYNYAMNYNTTDTGVRSLSRTMSNKVGTYLKSSPTTSMDSFTDDERDSATDKNTTTTTTR